MSLADAKKEADDMRKMLSAVMGSLRGSLKTHLMTGGIDLSPAAGGGAVRTGANHSIEGSHAEPVLLDWMANKYAGSVTPGVTVLYLYVYLSPCGACKNALLRAKNNYPNFAGYQLGFSQYFLTGLGGTGYQSLSEAQQAMQQMAGAGWVVTMM